MIFIIPVILGAAAVVTTGTGIGFGAKGINIILDREGNFNPAILKLEEKYKKMAV